MVNQLHATFEANYDWRLSADETLAETLLGRIRREIDRNAYSPLPLERVRSVRDTAKTPARKKLKLGPGVEIKWMDVLDNSAEPADVSTNWLILESLELLLIGGWALVGCFKPAGNNALFAPMNACRKYLNFVRNKIVSRDGLQTPDPAQVRMADFDMRMLWCDRMKQGRTLGEAIEDTEAMREALWLFTYKTEVANKRMLLTTEEDLDMQRKMDSRAKAHRAVKAAGSSKRYTKKGGSPDKGTGKQKVRLTPAPGVEPSGPQRKGRNNERAKGHGKAKGPPVVPGTSASRDAAGQLLCFAYNEGHCREPCPRGMLHKCNLLTKGGQPCGESHQRHAVHRSSVPS